MGLQNIEKSKIRCWASASPLKMYTSSAKMDVTFNSETYKEPKLEHHTRQTRGKTQKCG